MLPSHACVFRRSSRSLACLLKGINVAGMAGPDAEKVQQALVGVIAAVGALATQPADHSGASCRHRCTNNSIPSLIIVWRLYPILIWCNAVGLTIRWARRPPRPPTASARARQGCVLRGVMGTEWPLDLLIELTIP
jgi:hypothetical protein